MTELEKYLLELEDVLKKLYPRLWEKFNVGITPNDIINSLNAENIFNEQIVELYSWRNGINYDRSIYIGDFDLSSNGKIIPLQAAVELYKEYVKEGMWEKNFFPFITTYGGDYLLLDIDKSSNTFGKILIYSPSLWITVPEIIYESLEKFFLTIIDCYREGAYKFKSDNKLESNFDIEQQIAIRHNPSIKYWIQ